VSFGITVTACGFWYAKNLVRFGNPFWPFYFGHRTMDDQTYSNFVRGIHAYGPRTLHRFLEVPWRLAADQAVVPFAALSVVVLALAVRRARPFAAYAVVFTAYWFWLASHQVRFLLSGAAVATIAVTIALASGGRGLRLALAAAAVAAVVVAQTEVHPFSANAAGGALTAQLGSPKSGYAVGLWSRDAYFHRYAGCEADAVAYLDARPALSPVLVPQTTLAPWFAHTTRFGKLPLATAEPRAALAALRAGGYRSVLLRQGDPQHLATTDSSTAAVRARSTRIWVKDGCTILRIGRH
jgi:hypothetical protein